MYGKTIKTNRRKHIKIAHYCMNLKEEKNDFDCISNLYSGHFSQSLQWRYTQVPLDSMNKDYMKLEANTFRFEMLDKVLIKISLPIFLLSTAGAVYLTIVT